MSMLMLTNKAVRDLVGAGFMNGWFGDTSALFVWKQQHAALANMKQFFLLHHTNLIQYCGWDGAQMSRVAMELGLSIVEEPSLIAGLSLVEPS